MNHTTRPQQRVIGSEGWYYRHWLNALERLVAEKKVASDDALARYRQAWRHAAQRTPHGTPIALADEDF
jgi:hypothetical protein